MNFSILYSKYYHQVGFQDSATSLMEGIVELYAFVTFFFFVISGVVVWLLFQIIENYVLFPNSFTKVKQVDQFSKINLPITLRIIGASICARPGLDYWWNFQHISRDILWNRLLTLYIIVKAAQIQLYKIYLFARYRVLNKRARFVSNKTLELLWTSVPCLILISIALPSFYYLYISEENLDTLLSVKAIGYQWYWTYDYIQLFPVWFNNFLEDSKLDIDDYVIESYMEPTEYLNVSKGDSRLLECDNYLLLPTNIHIKLLVSSTDVLHSFAMPSLGIKIDAVPGRLNQVDLFLHRSGVFYGQCSEICGIGHGFMPICLYAISYLNFLVGKC